MNRFVLLTVLSVAPVMSLQASTYTIDSGHTYPNFTVNHMGFSTMYGQFSKTTGSFKLDTATKQASVDVVIDAASVYTGHVKRDNHLRSPDFLNVAEFPEITFKSSSVSWNGSRVASIEGDLTIMGVSKPVTLTVSDMRCANHPFARKPACGFDATASIKRSDYGMKYGLPGIGDQLKLSFQVEGILY